MGSVLHHSINMELNRFEKVMQEIIKRADRLGVSMSKDLEEKKPFGVEKVSDREQLYNYVKLSEPEKQFLRQSFPAGVYEQYEQKMQELGRKYNA